MVSVMQASESTANHRERSYQNTVSMCEVARRTVENDQHRKVGIVWGTPANDLVYDRSKDLCAKVH